MEELRHNEKLVKSYADVVEAMREKYPTIEGATVDVSETGNDLVLTIGKNSLYMTPEQAVDLMQELRRAVVKVKPKALRRVDHHGRDHAPAKR